MPGYIERTGKGREPKEPNGFLDAAGPTQLNARVKEPAGTPAGDAFAQRLWRPLFRRRVRIASKPMIPAILRSEHDDLIQEALVRAYGARETYKGESDEDLLKWVLVILRNLSRDVADKRSKEPEFEPLVGDCPGPKGDDPLKVAEAREGTEEEVRLPPSVVKWLATAKGVLGRLSADDQEILKLRVGMNFTVEETARMLGLTEGAVKMRYRRAFERVIELAKNAGLAPGGPRAEGTYPPPGPAEDADEEE